MTTEEREHYLARVPCQNNECGAFHLIEALPYFCPYCGKEQVPLELEEL